MKPLPQPSVDNRAPIMTQRIFRPGHGYCWIAWRERTHGVPQGSGCTQFHAIVDLKRQEEGTPR